MAPCYWPFFYPSGLRYQVGNSLVLFKRKDSGPCGRGRIKDGALALEGSKQVSESPTKIPIHLLWIFFRSDRKNIEAALVLDGYDPNRIRFRIHEIRGLLFTHPTRVLLLWEHTLTRYLNEIETNGTRQSVPYLRIVRAIRNSDLLL